MPRSAKNRTFCRGCAVVSGTAEVRWVGLLVGVSLWPVWGWAATAPAQSQAPALTSPTWVAPTESERSLVSDPNWPLIPSASPETARVVLPRNEVALLMAADEPAGTQAPAVSSAEPEAQRHWQDLARHSIAPLVLLFGALVLLGIAWHNSRRRRRRSRRRGAY